MMIVGYKILDKNMENRYGQKMEVGHTYTARGEIKFGVNGNGYHYCTNLAEIFRYGYCKNENFIAVKVNGIGKTIFLEDDYYGYNSLCVSSIITIDKILQRKEIIQKIIMMDSFSVEKFLKTFFLKEDEILLFKEKFKTNFSILNLISYYQENDKDVYIRQYQKRK